MKKRKILLVTGNFPPGIGGMQSYYHNLCRNSAHDVTVLAPHYPNDAAFDAEQPYDIIRGNFFRNETVHITGWPRMFRMALKTMRKEQIDLTIYGFVLIGLVGWLLKIFGGRPYMISTHGKDMLEFRRIPIVNSLVKSILRRADGILTNSEYTRGLVLDYGVDPSRIHLVFPGVEETFEKQEKDQALIQQLGLEGKYVLMTMGRLVKRKGHDQVIASLPRILEKIPNAVYLIAGDGPDRTRLEQLAQEHGVQNQVIFGGNVHNDDLNRYYSVCDQFIMVSRAMNNNVEGFGIVYLEAASCEKPVIAGDSGGVREAVLHRETGYLVKPESQDEIVKAVIEMHNDPDFRQESARKGYERAKGSFLYKQLAAQFDKSLELVCRRAEGLPVLEEPAPSDR